MCPKKDEYISIWQAIFWTLVVVYPTIFMVLVTKAGVTAALYITGTLVSVALIGRAYNILTSPEPEPCRCKPFFDLRQIVEEDRKKREEAKMKVEKEKELKAALAKLAEPEKAREPSREDMLELY